MEGSKKYVINLRNKKENGEDPHYDVYIGRNCGNLKATKWVNPYSQWHYPENVCLEKFEEKFWTDEKLYGSVCELRGKVLGCFCAPKQCHGDLLAFMANMESEDEFNAIVRAQVAKFEKVKEKHRAMLKEKLEKFKKSLRIPDFVTGGFFKQHHDLF